MDHTVSEAIYVNILYICELPVMADDGWRMDGFGGFTENKSENYIEKLYAG